MEKQVRLMYKDIDHQEEIEKFGFYYDNMGVLKSLTDPTLKYKADTQEEYEEFAIAVRNFIQIKVMEQKLGMIKSSGISEKDYIYYTNDFFTNEYGCLVMIQGSGPVRPGIWARQCCINESLDIGAMIRFVEKAKELKMSSLILNPNETSKPASVWEKLFDCETIKMPGKDQSVPESSKIIDNKISIAKCPAKRIFIIAHSAGGWACTKICKKFCNSLI